MLNPIKSFILRHILTKDELKKMSRSVALQEEYLPVGTFMSMHGKRPLFKEYIEFNPKLQGIEVSVACRYRYFFQEEPRMKGGVKVYPKSFLRTHVPLILLERVYGVKAAFVQMAPEAHKSKCFSKDYDK